MGLLRYVLIVWLQICLYHHMGNPKGFQNLYLDCLSIDFQSQGRPKTFSWSFVGIENTSYLCQSESIQYFGPGPSSYWRGNPTAHFLSRERRPKNQYFRCLSKVKFSNCRWKRRNVNLLGPQYPFKLVTGIHCIDQNEEEVLPLVVSICLSMIFLVWCNSCKWNRFPQRPFVRWEIYA